MPAWQTIKDFGGFQISAKPVGWRNKRIFKWLPYIYGGKPKFIITFKRLDKPEQYTQFDWLLLFPGGVTTHQPFNIAQLQPDDVHEELAGDRLLGLSGDTILGIQQQGDRGFHTLYSFKVVAVEDLVVSALIAVVAVLLGFVLSKL